MVDAIAWSVFTDDELNAMRVAMFTNDDIQEIADIVARDRVTVREAVAIWSGEWAYDTKGEE